jgi:hypothetical protein
MQLEAEGAGGLGRDVCVSSSTAKKTKMLWATLELVGVDFGGEARVGSGGSGFGVGITRGLLIGGSRALEAVTGERFKEGRGRSQGKWRHRLAGPAGPATAWRCYCSM